jgi:hypothetical protein
MPFLPLWMHSRYACCSWPPGPVNSVHEHPAKGDRIQTILLKITSALLEKVRVPDHGPPEKKDLIFSSCSDPTEERSKVTQGPQLLFTSDDGHIPLFWLKKDMVKPKCGGFVLCFEKEWHHKALRFNCKTWTQHGACCAFLIGGFLLDV